MTKNELIEAIGELDSSVKTDGLRAQELKLIHDGLVLPGKVSELENDVAELNAELEKSESQIKAKPGHTVVGKNADGTIYMTIPSVILDGQKYTAKDFAADENLVKKAQALGANYIIVK
jgi:uncharacterized small protein (DUF1192 family)